MNYKRGSGLFSSKKGMDIGLWFNTFELIVVLVAGAVLLQTINAEADSTTYEKIYFSRDNALLMNTIYSSPGDILYYYPEETGGFIFDFKQNKVEVYEDYELRESGAIGYPFAEDKNYVLSYKVLLPKKTQKAEIAYSKQKWAIDLND